MRADCSTAHVDHRFESTLSNPTAVVINVTAVNPTNVGFFTVYPGLTSRPLASDLNWATWETVPNLVVVKLGTDGSINSFGTTDVIVDVMGWYGDNN